MCLSTSVQAANPIYRSSQCGLVIMIQSPMTVRAHSTPLILYGLAENRKLSRTGGRASPIMAAGRHRVKTTLQLGGFTRHLTSVFQRTFGTTLISQARPDRKLHR